MTIQLTANELFSGAVCQSRSCKVKYFLDGIESKRSLFFFRFSGVTEESLRGITTTLREVQAVLLSMIHRDTILVGHSLESDLKATKVFCMPYTIIQSALALQIFDGIFGLHENEIMAKHKKTPLSGAIPLNFPLPCLCSF